MATGSSKAIGNPQFLLALTSSTRGMPTSIITHILPTFSRLIRNDFFWTQDYMQRNCNESNAHLKASPSQQTGKYIIIITGYLYPCSPYNLIVIATLYATCWRSCIHHSMLAGLPVSIISTGNVSMDFMWITSMLRKATPAKRGTASKICLRINLSVLPLVIMLVIRSWRMLSIVRQIGVAKE